MPAHRHRIGGLQDDIWKRNEETLRRLYLREHKTLKDVKKLMESEHGFPTTPLSTYESKLRDLGLRKKMKKKDWHPIYQHYVNSSHTHTALFFNGIRIPWEKAWKEIRRSGAREYNDGQASRLPADVVMRSPSPVLVVPRFDLPFRLPIPWELGDVSLTALSPTEVVHRSKLYDIPSNLLRRDMLNTFQQRAPTRGYPESDNPSFDHHFLPSPNRSNTEPILLQSSTLSHQSSQHSEIDWDIDNLSSALYRIANHSPSLYNHESSLGKALKVIINRTPKYALLKLLEGDSPTIQAAAENMVKFFIKGKGQKDGFFELLQVIYQFHPNWIDHGRYLELATNIGCVNSCRLLLQTWPWSKPYSPGYRDNNFYNRVFMKSIKRGHVGCAEVIAEHLFKSNTAPLHPAYLHAYEILWEFLMKVTLEMDPFNLRNPSVLHMLEWLLEAGVKIDLIPASHFDDYFSYANYWTPIILDYIYFRNLDLYSYLVEHSIQAKQEVTRSGAHHSASEGIDSLRSYLVSRAPHTPSQQDALLEILLIEELRRAAYRDNVDFNAIKTLLDYNLDLHKLHWKLNPSKMLFCVIKAAAQQGIHPAFDHIFEKLIYMGAAVLPKTLYAAVRGEGTTLLQLLPPLSADFKDQGASALCMAMRLDKYEAIDWLLAIGVDINATLQKDGNERQATNLTVFALANMDTLEHIGYKHFDEEVYYDIICGSEGSIINCEMLKYLVSRNVKLRANPNDPDLRRLLCLVIYNGLENRNDIWEDTLNKVKILLDTEPLTNEQQETEPCLLEACLINRDGSDFGAKLHGRLLVLDYLLERGISARYGGALALLIHHGAPRNLIEKVLYKCVDINTRSGRNIDYMAVLLRLTPLQAAVRVGSLDLVRLLLQRGAHIDTPPNQGPTALQTACEDYEDYLISIDMIKLLIENGADVNAPPTSDQSVRRHFTALQSACFDNNYDIVRLLIDNGANVNAPPSPHGGYTALQAACFGGTIDIVRFLIDNGAEVNAPPAPSVGRTAVHGAAVVGNFEKVLLLLKHGADINTHSDGINGCCSTLDESVERGRLDMVQFLLDLGAFSYDRGDSGYRGAIRRAEENSYLAIADIIRKHALKNGKTGEELFSHHSEWEDASGVNSKGSSAFNRPIDTWYENEGPWDEPLRLQ